MLASFAALVALLPFALAQDNAELQVESIHAQFQAAYIVPDLLKSFDPVASLTLIYGGNEVAAGSPLTVQRQFSASRRSPFGSSLTPGLNRNILSTEPHHYRCQLFRYPRLDLYACIS